MNLYLSSFRIGDSGSELASLCGPGRAFVVCNALDFSRHADHRQHVITREIEDLGKLGITAEPLDLRDFFGKPQVLRDHLENTAMLWVAGGNTFVLRRAMSLSGLDEFIRARKDDPGFLYAGYSAGVCVLSPSLEGIHLADHPQAEPEGYSGEVMWGGLGLIDYYFVPHYRCDHPESPAMEDVVAFYDQKALPYRTAADGQVIIDRTSGSEQGGGSNSVAPRLTSDVGQG